MSRFSGVIVAIFAALALTAMAPVAAAARGGGGGGGHFGGGGGGGHFGGGGGGGHFAGGGGHFSGGVRFSAARYGGARFAAVGRHVAIGGPVGGWRHGPYYGHYYRRFAGAGAAALIAGAYLGAGYDYYDSPYYGDSAYYSGGSDYSDGSDGSCVWVRQLVMTYYGPSWQLAPVCYGY
jgi:hypothetical protein